MSALHRMFKVISYEKLNQTADILLAANQEAANEIRKTGLNTLILMMNSASDMEELKKAMQRHQDSLDRLAAVDKAILELVSKTKE